MDARKKTTKIADISSELMAMFRSDDAETQKKLDDYKKLFDLLGGESVDAFQSMIRDLPDNIDRFFYNDMEKKNVDQINIDAILG